MSVNDNDVAKVFTLLDVVKESGGGCWRREPKGIKVQHGWEMKIRIISS